MSNPISSIDSHALDTVLGGARSAPAACRTSDPLLRTLTSLSTTIRDIGGVARRTGFSATQLLLLGLLLGQGRSASVFVRRPSW